MLSQQNFLQALRSSFRQRLAPITRASLDLRKLLKLRASSPYVKDFAQPIRAPKEIPARLSIGFMIAMVSSMRPVSVHWISSIALLIQATFVSINLAVVLKMKFRMAG